MTDSSNSTNIIPSKSYENAYLMKKKILIENKGKFGIYRWVNKVNGISYIGSAVNISLRLYSHYKGSKSNIILQEAILKHGLSNFSIEILEYCDKSILMEREQFYLDNTPLKYNLNLTAKSRFGAKHIEETRKKK